MLFHNAGARLLVLYHLEQRAYVACLKRSLRSYVMEKCVGNAVWDLSHRKREALEAGCLFVTEALSPPSYLYRAKDHCSEHVVYNL